MIEKTNLFQGDLTHLIPVHISGPATPNSEDGLRSPRPESDLLTLGPTTDTSFASYPRPPTVPSTPASLLNAPGGLPIPYEDICEFLPDGSLPRDLANLQNRPLSGRQSQVTRVPVSSPPSIHSPRSDNMRSPNVMDARDPRWAFFKKIFYS